MTSSLNLEPSWYGDADVHRREHHAIWARQWIVAALAEELSESGSYVADEIAGWPLLIRREPGGDLAAFLNVCPHRGGPLAWPGRGQSSNLVCRYHGWAFDSSGRLLSARDFGDLPCRADLALTPVRVDTWGPLVFVNLDPGAESLAASLGSLVDIASGLDGRTLQPVKRLTRELRCNWKTYVDNYLEAYHVPMIHPLLGSSIDVGSYTVDIPEASFCVHSARTVDGAPNSGRWIFRYPNLALNVYPDAMNVERILPIDRNRTRIVYDYFTHDPSGADISAMVHMSNVTLDEDQAMVETVQANLDSGAYRPGPLSPRHEQALVWFQNRIRHDIEETT
jgi:choline monooxygenase